MASAGFSFPKVLLIILDLSAQYNVDFGACPWCPNFTSFIEIFVTLSLSSPCTFIFQSSFSILVSLSSVSSGLHSQSPFSFPKKEHLLSTLY